MIPYKHDNVCKKCGTTYLHLCQMTWKEFGCNLKCHERFPTNLHLLGDKKEPEDDSRNNTILLLECLSLHLSPPPPPPRVLLLWKTRGQRRWPQNWTTWTVLVLEKQNMAENLTTHQENVSRSPTSTSNNNLFAAESKHHPSHWRYFRAAFASHNSKSCRVKQYESCL